MVLSSIYSVFRPFGVTVEWTDSLTLLHSNGTFKDRSRKVTTPERMLDAALNTTGVALCDSLYRWSADTGVVSHHGDAPQGTYVAHLGIGLGTGAIELWDSEHGPASP